MALKFLVIGSFIAVFRPRTVQRNQRTYTILTHNVLQELILTHNVLQELSHHFTQ